MTGVQTDMEGVDLARVEILDAAGVNLPLLWESFWVHSQ